MAQPKLTEHKEALLHAILLEIANGDWTKRGMQEHAYSHGQMFYCGNLINSRLWSSQRKLQLIAKLFPPTKMIILHKLLYYSHGISALQSGLLAIF